MNFDGATFSPMLDETRLTTQFERVKNVLLSGSWWTLKELALISSGSEASISARIRDLRKERFGGFDILRRRRGDPAKGVWEYHLKSPIKFNKDGQGEFI